MKYLFTIILMTLSFNSFSSSDKIITTKLSFNASTMIVGEFFFQTEDVVISDEQWEVRNFDFKVTSVSCNFSTPTYFYELRHSCSAQYNGEHIYLNLSMSTILMAAIPTEVHGGDAAGSLYYMIDELDCIGRSRSSQCVMKIKI